MMFNDSKYTPEEIARLNLMFKEHGFDSYEQYNRLYERAMERAQQRGGKHILNMVDWMGYDFTRKGLLQCINGTYKFKGIKIFQKDGKVSISFPDDPKQPIDPNLLKELGQEVDLS